MFDTPRKIIIGLFATLWVITATYAHAQERRMALVIGNGKYQFLPALRNPQNDAETMSVALANLGFTVYLANNLKQSELVAALATYMKTSKSADVSLVYYAGHGASLADENLFFPTDFNPDDPSQITTLVRLGELVKILSKGPKTNIFLFDACQEPITLTAQGRSFSTQSLAPKAPPIGTLISYASAPGSVAHDGRGNHSVFTGALLDNLAHPDNDIEQVLRFVRRDVISNSQGTQIPQTVSSLVTDFMLYPQSAPQSYQSLKRSLGQHGFSQKPVLSNVSSGLTAPFDALELAPETAILRDILCKKLSAPLPPICQIQE